MVTLVSNPKDGLYLNFFNLFQGEGCTFLFFTNVVFCILCAKNMRTNKLFNLFL